MEALERVWRRWSECGGAGASVEALERVPLISKSANMTFKRPKELDFMLFTFSNIRIFLFVSLSRK